VNGPLARDEFAELLASGEDSFCEFKDPRVSNNDLAKELCAFSNAAGGRVLIGVDDYGGLHDAADWGEERVMNVARTAIDPAIVPTYQRMLWNEQTTIAIVGVEAGAEKPYAVRSGEGRRYYVRVGSTSREPSREELIRLTQASGAVASDLRPVLGASAGDLVPELVAQRFAGRRTLDFAALDAAERRRVLVDADILHPDTEGPTIAGLLCFGRAPQERLPYAMLSCVAYSGTEPGRELADRVEVGGRVDEQIRGGLEFIARNLRAASTVRGAQRVEAARPSTESLRELIVNAVVHRHYGIAGPIQVRVFTDRIEVSSPGAPPNGVTPQAMRVGVSIWRNQFLVQHLTSLGLVDAVGRGIVLLFEEAASLGLPEPIITVVETWTKIEFGLGGRS